jgi:hypothetical protein
MFKANMGNSTMLVTILTRHTLANIKYCGFFNLLVETI